MISCHLIWCVCVCVIGCVYDCMCVCGLYEKIIMSVCWCVCWCVNVSVCGRCCEVLGQDSNVSHTSLITIHTLRTHSHPIIPLHLTSSFISASATSAKSSVFFFFFLIALKLFFTHKKTQTHTHTGIHTISHTHTYVLNRICRACAAPSQAIPLHLQHQQ